MKVLRWVVLSCLASVLLACSSERIYSAGRAAQRTECNKQTDALQRDRCFKDADMSYETYQREAASAPR